MPTLRSRADVRRHRDLAAAAATVSASRRMAQAAADPTLDPVVVTATRRAERSFDVPASIDIIDARDDPRRPADGQPVRDAGARPGDLRRQPPELRAGPADQLARLRRARDVRRARRAALPGRHPATMPDGQGQTGSFSLLSAARIEVLRGPVLDALRQRVGRRDLACSPRTGRAQPVLDGQRRRRQLRDDHVAAQGHRARRPASATSSAATRFATDGYREHSAAARELANAKLTFAPDGGTRVTLVGTSQYQPDTQDPLGLTRAQWEANPRRRIRWRCCSTRARRSTSCRAGVRIEHAFDPATTLRRHRLRRQPRRAPVPRVLGRRTDLVGRRRRPRPRFRRRRRAAGARVRDRRPPAAHRRRPTSDRSDERRRASSTTTASLGDLRRDEDDTVAQRRRLSRRRSSACSTTCR